MPKTEENYDITSMPNEAPMCAELPPSKSYYNLKQDDSDDSLRSILARPVVVATGVFGSTPGVTLTVPFTSASDFRSNFTTQQWDRLLGYLGIRFTLNITVAISKTAFNQGIVSVNFQYGVSNNNKLRSNFFPLSVHVPNTRINIAENTMMQLTVPFVYAEEYVRAGNIGTDVLPYGTISIVNLTGCPVAASQSQAKFTLYLSLTDVEFIGHQPFATTILTVQSGLDKNANTSKVHLKQGQIAKEGKSKGVLSSTTRALSKVAQVAGYVPGLQAVAGTADWLLRGATGALEAFGYSKPLDETMPTRVYRSAYAGDGQVDIPDIGYPIAPFSSNKLAIDGTVGCNDEDQLALDYVLSKYSYIYRGSYSTANVPGDVIYTCPVTPSAFWYRDVSLSTILAKGNTALKSAPLATENAFLPSTLCYVSDNFRYWRGNLKFRVTFAGTKLHGGRVLFAFVPQRFLSNLNANNVITTNRVVPQVSALGPNPTGDGVIFDLQDSSVFEFEVPFVYPNAYCGVLSEYIGDVSMTVVQPLSANVSVPTTVNFMVEVCASPGFELACVCPSMMAPIPATGTVSLSYQTGITPVEVSSEASQQTMGEIFKSLKSLIQMKDYFTIDIPTNSLPIWSLDPWFKPNSPALATPMPTNTVALYYAAKSSRIAEMYSFVRGGTSYSIFKDTDVLTTHNFYMSADDGGTLPTTTYSLYDKANIPYGIVTLPESLESGRAVAPLYAKIPRIPLEVRDSAFGGARGIIGRTAWNTTVTLSQPLLSIRNQSGGNLRCLIGRAAADDALASQFVGPPPVILLQALQVAGPAFTQSDF